MRNLRWIYFTLVPILIGLTMVACGGGGGSVSVGPSNPGKYLSAWLTGTSTYYLSGTSGGIYSGNGVSLTALSSGVRAALHKIQQSPGGKLFAVGSNGVAVTSNNQGVSWSKVSHQFGVNLRSVDFPSVDVGYIVGAGGKIFRSTDAGLTWSELNSPAATLGGDLTDVDFLTPLIGWVIGDSGRIYYTTDGGADWTAQDSGTIQNLNGIFALNRNLAWVVGNQGLLVYTTDSGTTWTRAETNTINDLYDVGFRSRSSGVFVGDAIISTSSNSGNTWTQLNLAPDIMGAFRGVSVLDANLLAVGQDGTAILSDDFGASFSELSVEQDPSPQPTATRRPSSTASAPTPTRTPSVSGTPSSSGCFALTGNFNGNGGCNIVGPITAGASGGYFVLSPLGVNPTASFSVSGNIGTSTSTNLSLFGKGGHTCDVNCSGAPGAFILHCTDAVGSSCTESFS